MSTSTVFGGVLILGGAVISLSGIGLIFGIPMIILGVFVFFGAFTAKGASKAAGAVSGGGQQPPQRMQGQPPAHSQGVQRQIFAADQTHETIGPDEFLFYEFNVPEPAIFEIFFETFDGGPINVFVMLPEEFEKYKLGNQFRTFDNASILNQQNGSNKTRLQRGQYVLVFDNTSSPPSPGDTNMPVNLELNYEVFP